MYTSLCNTTFSHPVIHNFQQRKLNSSLTLCSSPRPPDSEKTLTFFNYDYKGDSRRSLLKDLKSGSSSNQGVQLSPSSLWPWKPPETVGRGLLHPDAGPPHHPPWTQRPRSVLLSSLSGGSYPGHLGAEGSKFIGLWEAYW